MMLFPGIHQPSDAGHFDLACISINRLERRRKAVGARWVLGDSGAFTKVNKFGGYPEPPEAYARKVHRIHVEGVVRYLAIVAEDYMCEPFVVARTGLSIAEHQRLTVERYDALCIELARLFGGAPPFHVMPVLQGQSPQDYVRHVEMYGHRLTSRMWVGVGSVCKRQGNIAVIEDLLAAIKEVRPDLRLHGFWREADRAAQPGRAPAAVQRRQHGLVVLCSETGARRQRLARGQSVRRQGPARRARAGTAAPAARGVTRLGWEA